MTVWLLGVNLIKVLIKEKKNTDSTYFASRVLQFKLCQHTLGAASYLRPY